MRKQPWWKKKEPRKVDASGKPIISYTPKTALTDAQKAQTYQYVDSNGDTQTSGYTSLHYETSCTIYGSDALTGQLICH